jgi:hypothetical protein
MLRTIRAGQNPKVYVKVVPNPLWGWARILHNKDRFDNVPETLAPDEAFTQDYPIVYPDGVRLGNLVPWKKINSNIDWWPHYDEINNPAARLWGRNYESMCFNDGIGGVIDDTKNVNIRPDDGGGNIFAFDARSADGKFLRQVCFQNTQSIIGLKQRYFDDPFYRYVYYFYPSAINRAGSIFKIGGGSEQGLDIWVPRITAGERWIPVENCQMLTTFPTGWTYLNVLAP